MGSRKIIPVGTGISGLLIFLLLLGCQHKTFDSEGALLAYLKEDTNGYVQQKTVNGINFTLMYRPTDLLVEQELSETTGTDQIEALREKYSKYMYFNLSMSKDNQELLSAVPGNHNEFGAMVNQLAFEMDNAVHLYTKRKDTLEMIDFVYPRMYGMSRSTTLLFVFPRDKKTLEDDYLNFTIEDFGLKTGEIKFKINTEDIKNQPILSFKE